MTDTAAATATIPAIERELDLAASPDRVWRALTDSGEVAQWFPQRAEIPQRAGGIGWMEWDGHPRYMVRVEAWEPERYLAWRWASETDEDFDRASNLVEWWLEPAAGGGTTLRLRESGFESGERRGGNVEGWISELGELLALLGREPWEQGIRRTWQFQSSPDRVWRAFSDEQEFNAWWGGTERIELRPGFAGWFAWPTEGRFAMRIDRVEPPTYLAWRWTTAPGVPFDEATEVLRTEWAILPREGGGTTVQLLETGFRGPENHHLNSQGWDSDVSPVLARVLGEPEAAPPIAG